ncbi:substrate-binding periplasmic protein [Arenibacterium sp. CAU 1754]
MTRLGLSLCLAMIAGVLNGTPAFARCEDHVPQAKPQNTARSVVGADLDAIMDRGTISFAAYDDFPPWSYMDRGKPTGIDIEIGQLIAESIGVKPQFNLVSAGEDLEADLRNWVWKGPVVGGQVANVMLHVPYDSNFSCRVDQVAFTGIYFVEEVAIAFRRDAYPDDPPLPAYFRFDTVAVENDSIADFYLTSFPGGQLGRNLRRYPTVQQAMSALASGETMAAMGPRAQLEHGLTDALDVHTPPLPGFGVGKWTNGVAVHFAYRALGYAVDDAIAAAIQDGRMAAIFDRYGVTYQPPALR